MRYIAILITNNYSCNLDHDFVEEPLFIKSESIEENELKESDEMKLRDYFNEKRLELFKSYGIIVSSSADKNRSLLTRKGPSFAIVKKLQTLANISSRKVNIKTRICALCPF